MSHKLGYLNAVLLSKIKDGIVEAGFDPDKFHLESVLSCTELRNGIIRSECNKENKDLICQQYNITFTTLKEILINRR